jgi:hypothetical protein
VIDVPLFPKFRPIAVGDKELLDRFNRSVGPYAETALATLIVWNPPNEARISQLGGGVVLRHHDCGTGESVFTFLGANRPAGVARTLVDFDEGPIGLVPDHAVAGVTEPEWEQAGLELVADRDNDDYVYDLELLATLEGGSFKGRRKRRNAFARSHAVEFRALDLRAKSDVDAVHDSVREWLRQKEDKGTAPPAGELVGIERLLKLGLEQQDPGLWGFGVELSGELVAVSLVESHCHEMVSGVAFKALPSLVGASEYLRSVSARALRNFGFRQINVQQDMGVQGLRATKSSYRPTRMRRKWRVRRLEQEKPC